MQEESQPLTYGHLASGQDPGEDLTNSDNNEAHVEKQSGNDYSSEGKSGHSHGFVNEQLKSYDTTGDQQHNASADQENKTSSENIINKIFKADSSKLFHQESYTEQIVNNDEEGKEQRDYHDDINEDKNKKSDDESDTLHPLPTLKPISSENLLMKEQKEKIKNIDENEQTEEATDENVYESEMYESSLESTLDEVVDEEEGTVERKNITTEESLQEDDSKMEGENVFATLDKSTNNTKDFVSMSSSTEATVKAMGSHLQNQTAPSSDNNLNIKIERNMQVNYFTIFCFQIMS